MLEYACKPHCAGRLNDPPTRFPEQAYRVTDLIVTHRDKLVDNLFAKLVCQVACLTHGGAVAEDVQIVETNRPAMLDGRFH